MKCFEHTDLDAVGVCKSCGKGVCRQCAADLGNGLACSGRCNTQVNALIAVEANAIGAYQAAKRGYSLAPLFLISAGTIFVATGLLSDKKGLGFTVILGGIFVAFGVATWLRAARFARNLK